MGTAEELGKCSPSIGVESQMTLLGRRCRQSASLRNWWLLRHGGTFYTPYQLTILEAITNELGIDTQDRSSI